MMKETRKGNRSLEKEVNTCQYLVASDRDLQNHSGIPHMAGVQQWMDVGF